MERALDLAEAKPKIRYLSRYETEPLGPGDYWN